MLHDLVMSRRILSIPNILMFVNTGLKVYRQPVGAADHLADLTQRA
jgi:hypothetical protein